MKLIPNDIPEELRDKAAQGLVTFFDWIAEEREALRQKGASDEDLAEPALKALVHDRVWERICAEKDPSQREQLVAAWCVRLLSAGSPERLREVAEMIREFFPNYLDSAYDLEKLADDRQRQGWEI